LSDGIAPADASSELIRSHTNTDAYAQPCKRDPTEQEHKDPHAGI